MFKMRYDGSGAQNWISVVSDVSTATGTVLAVHVSIGVGPNAQKYLAFADGQNDMVLISTIDDDPNARELKIQQIFPDGGTGRFDHEGRQGMKDLSRGDAARS